VYTGNTLLRAAFVGSGANAVTYYACKQRYQNGSTRDCQVLGTGSYAIATLGDARTLSFNNLPVQAAPLTYTRVFVERGGAIYFGYQSKPAVTKSARLNTVAANAFLTQLGVTAEDPSVPLALTATSYQGTWDVREASSTVSPTNGTTVFINADGTSSCQDKSDSSFFACTVTITNPATGAFTFSDATSTASGTMNFATGTLTGTFNDPTSTPATGAIVGGRR
jgi:trimeric autotransporter adhesin